MRAKLPVHRNDLVHRSHTILLARDRNQRNFGAIARYVAWICEMFGNGRSVKPFKRDAV